MPAYGDGPWPAASGHRAGCSAWERLSKLADWNLPQIDEHEEKGTESERRITAGGERQRRLKLEELESVRDLGPSRVKVFVIWFRDSEKCRVYLRRSATKVTHRHDSAALHRAGLAH